MTMDRWMNYKVMNSRISKNIQMTTLEGFIANNINIVAVLAHLYWVNHSFAEDKVLTIFIACISPQLKTNSDTL